MQGEGVEVRVDFVARALHDMEEGRLLPVDDYLSMYAGHEELIRAEYASLTKAAEDAPADGGRIGRFKLLGTLGRGGQATVHRALDETLGREVALKVLDAGTHATESLLRFRREAEITSKLDHPGLCVVHEVGRSHGRTYIAMRLIEGEPFTARIQDRSRLPRDRDSVMATVHIIEKAARAIHVAHEAGIVHRDLKPGNLMIDRDDEPVVVDFGLARDERATDAAPLTMTGTVFGTPGYMSPEQLSGSHGPLDRRTDVYSLGVTLFEALTGQRPFDAPTIRELMSQVSGAPLPDPRGLNAAIGRDLVIVLETAMERDVARRYSTAAALAEDLRRIRSREPILAVPAGPILRLRRWASRNPALAVTVAAAFLLFLVAFVQERRRSDQAVQEQAKAERLTAEKQAALSNVLRLSDSRTLADLLRTEGDLWPISPQLAAPGIEWLETADGLLSRRAQHEAMLARVREGAAVPESPWLIDVLEQILEDMDSVEDLRESVSERVERSKTIRRRTIIDAVDAWRDCAEDIVETEEFGGLRLEPQLGLVPLGVSEVSGLWEFWHVPSGARPEPRRDGWEVRPETGIVFVLIPPGTFRMGDLHNDPRESEKPVHEITLDAFFASKYELTQAQWMRVNHGVNPSYYFPGTDRATQYERSKETTLTHPVEFVSWDEADRTMRRLGCMLPTEAQWEFACRAGTTTRWWTGTAESGLQRAANVFGLEQPTRRRGRRASFDDDWLNHAPVGSFRANPFGLHDVHGNVAEFCAEPFIRKLEDAEPRSGDGYLEGPTADPDTRVCRGGSFFHVAESCESSCRMWPERALQRYNIGVRAFRRLDP